MEIILLYYKYIHISNPIEIQKWQTALCTTLGLKGRILLAHEGINGTISGSQQATQEYIQAMNQHPLFGNIDFKTATSDGAAFPRLRILIKNEIVRLGVDPNTLTVAQTGTHLTPAQTHELLSNPPQDLVILDARNNYEWAVGKFENAVLPNIKNFREFPEYIDQNVDNFKDKTVLMYCTGGVRCERATSYLNVKNVAKKVYQIEGGIHRYVEQFPDGFFRGKNYVFDNRVVVRVNEDILSSCLNCPTPSDEYYNCLNALCNKHFTGCSVCIQNLHQTCSQKCKDLIASNSAPQREPFCKISQPIDSNPNI